MEWRKSARTRACGGERRGNGRVRDVTSGEAMRLRLERRGGMRAEGRTGRQWATTGGRGCAARRRGPHGWGVAALGRRSSGRAGRTPRAHKEWRVKRGKESLHRPRGPLWGVDRESCAVDGRRAGGREERRGEGGGEGRRRDGRGARRDLGRTGVTNERACCEDIRSEQHALPFHPRRGVSSSATHLRCGQAARRARRSRGGRQLAPGKGGSAWVGRGGGRRRA